MSEQYLSAVSHRAARVLRHAARPHAHPSLERHTQRHPRPSHAQAHQRTKQPPARQAAATLPLCPARACSCDTSRRNAHVLHGSIAPLHTHRTDAPPSLAHAAGKTGWRQSAGRWCTHVLRQHGEHRARRARSRGDRAGRYAQSASAAAVHNRPTTRAHAHARTSASTAARSATHAQAYQRTKSPPAPKRNNLTPSPPRLVVPRAGTACTTQVVAPHVCYAARCCQSALGGAPQSPGHTPQG